MTLRKGMECAAIEKLLKKAISTGPLEAEKLDITNGQKQITPQLD